MRLTDYAIKSLRLDRELRATSRIVAYAFDAFRHASILAFLLLCLDLTPWALFPASDVRARLTFVVIWALMMALVNLVRDRVIAARMGTDRNAAT